MHWLVTYWELIAALAVVAVDVANRLTKHWTQRKTVTGKVLAFILEFTNLISVRKPTLQSPERKEMNRRVKEAMRK
jgi:hypothetical protein